MSIHPQNEQKTQCLAQRLGCLLVPSSTHWQSSLFASLRALRCYRCNQHCPATPSIKTTGLSNGSVAVIFKREMFSFFFFFFDAGVPPRASAER